MHYLAIDSCPVLDSPSRAFCRRRKTATNTTAWSDGTQQQQRPLTDCDRDGLSQYTGAEAHSLHCPPHRSSSVVLDSIRNRIRSGIRYCMTILRQGTGVLLSYTSSTSPRLSASWCPLRQIARMYRGICGTMFFKYMYLTGIVSSDVSHASDVRKYTGATNPC